MKIGKRIFPRKSFIRERDRRYCGRDSNYRKGQDVCREANNEYSGRNFVFGLHKQVSIFMSPRKCDSSVARNVPSELISQLFRKTDRHL